VVPTKRLKGKKGDRVSTPMEKCKQKAGWGIFGNKSLRTLGWGGGAREEETGQQV